MNLLLDQEFGIYEMFLANNLMLATYALKVSATYDPATPRLHEALGGEHQEEFLIAMGKDIAELEEINTRKVVRKSSLPKVANLLPSTWAFKLKRYPDGRMRKHKARLCAQGYKKIEIVDYFEIYAPVAACYSVHMVTNISIQQE